uniref:ATP-binding cassette sub-family B member 6 n=1 Tax=Schistocephalus solidus TaxID=70667 RepID=A0A0X3PF57_SCHSO
MNSSYCPADQPINQFWINNGLNRCLFMTISASISIAISLLALCSHLYYVFKYPRVLNRQLRPLSYGYFFQITFGVLIPLIIIARLLFLAIENEEDGISLYGYAIFNAVLSPFSWILVVCMLALERQRLCPELFGRSHAFSLLLFWTLNFVLINMPLTSIGSAMWWWKLESFRDRVELVLWVVEYACVLVVFLLGFRAPGLPNYALLYENLTNEQRIEQPPLTRWQRFRKRCIFLLPFILPKRNYLIQLNIFLCTVILVSGRIVNLYVPILYKNVVNSLTPITKNNTPPHSDQPVQVTEFTNNNYLSYFYVLLVGPTGLIYRWDLILLYIGVRAIQGVGSSSSGLLGALQSQLWIPVDQFSSRTLGIHLFQHLHDQSMNWHLSRKTGAMLRIVDRGTSSISNILNYLLFNMIPTIVDIIVGIVYFITAFNFWYGLIVFITMLAYLVITVLITEWRTKFRRTMNNLDNVKSGVAVDSLLNFETVKYYTAESFEVNRYKKAVIDYQRASWQSSASLSLLNVTQSLIISLGLLIGTLLCAHAVVAGNLTLGDFVLFCTYVTQLYLPLNFFGTYYRMLQSSFVDLENMFELLEEHSKILDIPDATVLTVRGGKIEFQNVNFCYIAERPVLKNISFTVEPGKKLALVGQTGSGKSTVIRLLFRFYEPSGGRILIDDQDISKVKQKSLRQAIGVVPQKLHAIRTSSWGSALNDPGRQGHGTLQ